MAAPPSSPPYFDGDTLLEVAFGITFGVFMSPKKTSQRPVRSGAIPKPISQQSTKDSRSRGNHRTPNRSPSPLRAQAPSDRQNRGPHSSVKRAGRAGSGPVGYWVMGRNAVAELIRVAPERVLEVWCTPESASLLSGLSRQVPIHADTERGRLTALVNSDSHQGIVVRATPRTLLGLAEILAAIPADSPALLVLPDSINDPQNLGAILRAAECFGADGVILNRNRGCPVTPVVTKSGVGATELIPLIEVSNADHALRLCQQHHFWVVAASRGHNAQPLEHFTFPSRTLLIVGSEGDGIQPLLVKRADHLVSITQYGAIDSLNVSQATAVLCHEYRRHHVTRARS